MAGPPLWYCPVECRNRGPQPNVTGRPVRSGQHLAEAGVLGQADAVEVGLDGDVAVEQVELGEQLGRRPPQVGGLVPNAATRGLMSG